jgi:hypothetical protein
MITRAITSTGFKSIPPMTIEQYLGGFDQVRELDNDLGPYTSGQRVFLKTSIDKNAVGRYTIAVNGDTLVCGPLMADDIGAYIDHRGDRIREFNFLATVVGYAAAA